MRRLPESIAIATLIACVCACAPKTELQLHWGETSRAATEAQIQAAKSDAGRGIDGAGAAAAAENYQKSRVTPTRANTPPTVIQVGKPD